MWVLGGRGVLLPLAFLLTRKFITQTLFWGTCERYLTLPHIMILYLSVCLSRNSTGGSVDRWCVCLSRNSTGGSVWTVTVSVLVNVVTNDSLSLSLCVCCPETRPGGGRCGQSVCLSVPKLEGGGRCGQCVCLSVPKLDGGGSCVDRVSVCPKIRGGLFLLFVGGLLFVVAVVSTSLHVQHPPACTCSFVSP